MRIVVTGAAGNVGSKIADELSRDHSLVLIDRRTRAGHPIRRADLARSPSLVRSRSGGWARLFADIDVIVHCGGDPRPDAGMRSVSRNNLRATWNVLEAAAAHRVSRVVYMSSNWAVRAAVEELGPDRLRPDGPKLDSDLSVRPLGPYGFSKAASEILGRMYVDQDRLDTFISVRIGHCPPDGIPHPSDRVMRSHWISDGDLQELARRCVEAPVRGYHVVYGVSAQPESPFDLTRTRALLDWSPRDRSRPLRKSR